MARAFGLTNQRKGLTVLVLATAKRSARDSWQLRVGTDFRVSGTSFCEGFSLRYAALDLTIVNLQNHAEKMWPIGENPRPCIRFASSRPQQNHIWKSCNKNMYFHGGSSNTSARHVHGGLCGACGAVGRTPGCVRAAARVLQPAEVTDDGSWRAEQVTTPLYPTNPQKTMEIPGSSGFRNAQGNGFLDCRNPSAWSRAMALHHHLDSDGRLPEWLWQFKNLTPLRTLRSTNHWIF